MNNKNISKELVLEMLEDISIQIKEQVDMDTFAEVEAEIKMIKEYINY